MKGIGVEGGLKVTSWCYSFKGHSYGILPFTVDLGSVLIFDVLSGVWKGSFTLNNALVVLFGTHDPWVRPSVLLYLILFTGVFSSLQVFCTRQWLNS